MNTINGKIKNIINNSFKEKGFTVKSIILFGSRARGDATPKSDWDFLIVTVENLSLPEKRRLSKQIRTKLAEIQIPCDIIIKSGKEIEIYKDFIGTVTREALKEGVEL